MKRNEIDDLFKELEIEADETKKKAFADRVMKINGDDINKEKTNTETVRNDLKVKEGLIEELNDKIKELGSVDIEKIKQEQFDLGKAEGSKEFENFKKTSALKEALSGFKAKDISIIQKMLDNDKIEYEEKDGNYTVKGLEDQINSIKESHSYLFEDEKTQTKTIDLGGNHNGNTNMDSDMEAVAKAMGLEVENKK